MAKKYIALDAEFFWDKDLYKQHKAMDPKSNHHAVAVKKVMAAGVFQFTIDEEGRVCTGEIGSWTERDWADEAGVVSRVFDYLRSNDGKPIITYGGLATDVPIFLHASIAHGLRLPPQLIDQPGRKGPRPHLDLGLMMKGGGKTWTHLSQLLLRIGVPFDLVAAKSTVPRPASAGAWQNLRDHVELDCLLLAIAKIGWLVAQGTNGLRLEPAIVALVEGFLRRRPDHGLANELRAFVDSLHGKIAEGFADAA
jgi:hypothetical protein